MSPDGLLPRDSRKRKMNLDAWAPWILVALGILFFADPLFSSRNFYFRDILNFHYSLRRVLIDAWSRGEFPLWNPLIYFGQPMLANPNYLAFYPTNLFHLLLPFNYAFKLHFIVHPLLAGPGLYLLQRRLGILPLAALGGAAAYQFSGVLLSFLNLYNILPAVALLPWIGWAFVGALHGNWLRRSIGFGALLAVQIVALEPLMFQCEILLLAGLALWHLLESGDRPRALFRMFRVVSVGIPFALGLAAVQVLPTLQMLPSAIRGSGIDFSLASRWSMHPMDFLSTIVPNLFGDPFAIGYATSWGEAYHHGDVSILVSFFVGTGTLLLALVSFGSERTKLQRVMTFAVLSGTILAQGRFTPVYPWLFAHVPGLSAGRYPAKYFLLVTLALCVLAALGLEVLSRRTGARSADGIIRIVGVAGILLGVIFSAAAIYCQVYPEPMAQWIRAQAVPQQAAGKAFGAIQGQLLRSLFSTGVFFPLSGGLVLLSRIRSRALPVGGLFVALLLGELMPASLRLAPVISGADLDLVPEVDRYIMTNGPARPFRVVSPNWLPPIPIRLRAPNRSLAWASLFERMTGQTLGGIPRGIEYSLDRSIDLLNTADSEELYRRCLMLPEASRLALMGKLNSPVVLSIGRISHPSLRYMASFDTLSDQPLTVNFLADSLPRAYFASRVLAAPSHSGALDLLLRPDAPLHDTVILERMAPAYSTNATVKAETRILDYRSRYVRCETESSLPGNLVLLDSYYPGWRASVDGKEVEIRRANFAFRAVEVPAGKHRIEFTYSPWPFYLGLALTLITAVAGLAVLGRFRAAPVQAVS